MTETMSFSSIEGRRVEFMAQPAYAFNAFFLTPTAESVNRSLTIVTIRFDVVGSRIACNGEDGFSFK